MTVWTTLLVGRSSLFPLASEPEAGVGVPTPQVIHELAYRSAFVDILSITPSPGQRLCTNEISDTST